MKNDYLLPGIAAIILAMIFPTWAIYELLSLSNGSWKDVLIGINEWGFAEFLFLLTGILSIFVFFSFKKILNDQLNFNSIDAPLWIMIGINLVFHILLLVLEFIVGLTSPVSEGYEMFASGLTIASVVAFGIIDIVIGVILLTKSNKLPSILKVLAVVSIIQGVFEISIFMFFLVIVTFPIYMITLSIYFMRKPETIEVV